MSLVAYDSSDDSDSEDIQYENREDRDVPLNYRTNTKSSDGSQPTSDQKSLFSSLPAPKSLVTNDLEPECEVEVEQARTSTKGTGKSGNQPIKIYLEPLSQFAEVDKSVRKPPRIQSSGSGLFSVLPPPKNTKGKVANRSLVPHSLTRKSAPPETKPSKPIRKPIATVTQDVEEDDSDPPEDFFGLQNTKPVSVNAPDTTVKMITTEKASIGKLLLPPTLNPDVEMDEAASSTLDTEQTEIMDESTANISKALKIDDLFQDQAFIRVRGKKRAFEEETEIIDVSQDDQMPTWEERAKLLTQEDENAYVNAGPQPSAQHRRKHQITYLAYQAKARELELKNQWASNRFTKQQTRAKYGF
ncbi:hypothetical protein CHUAL_000425 [Chamberlinius hualienensis]